jgi:hypothetical protein
VETSRFTLEGLADDPYHVEFRNLLKRAKGLRESIEKAAAEN